MKKLLIHLGRATLCGALILPLSRQSHAGTNAPVTFNTNTFAVTPTNIWRTNSAGIIDALTNAGFTGGGGGVPNYATNASTATNLLGGGTGNTLTNLKAYSGVTLESGAALNGLDNNLLNLDGNYDGNGDNILLSNKVYGQGITLDGWGNIDFSVLNTSTGGGFIFGPLSLGTPPPIVAHALVGGNLVYIQPNSAAGAWLMSAASETEPYQGILTLAPQSFSVPHSSDGLVLAGNSNNYTMIAGTRATLQLNAIWWNFTNISGLSAYTADMGDRRIVCNPTAAACQITLPALGPFGANLPAGTNWFPWTYALANIGGGSPRGPAFATLDYVVENTGSNTANTLSVCLADHTAFTNLGTTNLVIPNQTSARFTTEGTNVLVEFSAMTVTDPHNGTPTLQLTQNQANQIMPNGCTAGYYLTATDYAQIIVVTNNTINAGANAQGYICLTNTFATPFKGAVSVSIAPWTNTAYTGSTGIGTDVSHFVANLVAIGTTSNYTLVSTALGSVPSSDTSYGVQVIVHGTTAN